MEALLRRGIGPLYTQVRFKYHSKRPRPKILERRILEKIVAPIYPEDLQFDISKVCTTLLKEKNKERDNARHIGANKFEEFLIKEAHKILDANFMFAAVDLNKTIMRRFYEIRSLLLDYEIATVVLPHEVFRKAFLQSERHANFAQVIGTHTALLASKEDRVKQLLKTLRRAPEMHLLGGIVGEGMFTRQGLEDYVKLPDLHSQRSHLVSTLGQSSSTLSLLQQHQRVLISRLSRIGLKDEKE